MEPSMDELEEQIERTRRELRSVRRAAEQERSEHQSWMKEWSLRHDKIEQGLHKTQTNAYERVKLHEYVSVIQKIQGERRFVSQYLISYEAQVCRAVHQMITKQHQERILTKHCEAITEYFESYKAQAQEEANLVKDHLFNLIMQVEAEKRSLHQEYLTIRHSQDATMSTLYRELDSVDDDGDDDESVEQEEDYDNHFWTAGGGFLQRVFEHAQNRARRAGELHPKKGKMCENPEDKDDMPLNPKLPLLSSKPVRRKGYAASVA